MCCPLVFEFSVGIGGFVPGLGQISFFFSHELSKVCRQGRDTNLLLYCFSVLFLVYFISFQQPEICDFLHLGTRR